MKQCKNCGKTLEENELFCQSCGQKYEEEIVNEVESMSTPEVSPVVEQPVMPVNEAPVMENQTASEVNVAAPEVAPVVEQPVMPVNEAPAMENQTAAEVSIAMPEVSPVVEQPAMPVNEAPVMENQAGAEVNVEMPEVSPVVEQPVMPANETPAMENQAVAEVSVSMPGVAPVVEQPVMPVNESPVMENQVAAEVNVAAPGVSPVVEQPVMPVNEAPVMENQAASEVNVAAPGVSPVVEQPANNQVVNNTQPDSKKGNKNLIFIILAIVLVLIIIGLGVFIIIKVVSKNTSKVVKNYQPYTTTTVSGSNVSNSNTFTSGGYTFTLPEGLYHTMESNLNAIYDSSKSFAVAFQVSFYDYESIKNNPASFAENLKQQSNMNVNGYTVNNHSGREYVEIDVEYSGYEAKYIFSKMDDNKVAMGAVMVQSTTFDNALDKFTGVLNSGKRSSGDSTQDFSISTEEQDIPNFIEAIK